MCIYIFHVFFYISFDFLFFELTKGSFNFNQWMQDCSMSNFHLTVYWILYILWILFKVTLKISRLRKIILELVMFCMKKVYNKIDQWFRAKIFSSVVDIIGFSFKNIILNMPITWLSPCLKWRKENPLLLC